MQDLIQVASSIPYVWFCGVYNGMVSIILYGIMVWHVSKYKHKESLGTFGSVVERLEGLWKR